MFGGLTHEPAVGLARRLVDITPEPLQHVFLADSGSVSVEVAVKMCLQYQRSRGTPGAHAGCSPGAAATTATPSARCRSAIPRAACTSSGPASCRARSSWTRRPTASTRPLDPAYVAHVADAVERHRDELAAIIVEPVVQGAGGMRFHSPALSDGPARDRRRERRPARVRRDRHRLRPHRGDVRRRPRRGQPRRDVRRQGDDRRLHDDGGDALHRRGGRGHLRRRGPRAGARADLHGQPARGGRGQRLDRPAARRRPGAARSRASRPACGPGWSRRARSPASPTCGCSARSAWCSSTARWTWSARAGRRSRPGSGCAPSATSSTRCRPT